MVCRWVLFLPLVLTSPCPGDDWVEGHGSCYLVSPSAMTWYQGQEYCGGHGGYLAEINTMAEQSYLTTILPSSGYYWVGLSDLAHPGTYTWQHSYTTPAFTNWGGGEPDGGSQHCVFIWGGHGYQWADYVCDKAASSGGSEVHALCESGGGGEELNILWLGNSYTYKNDVPQLVSNLASADGIPIHWDSHTEGGWTWEMHASSEETMAKIRERQWDVVILQEQSLRPAYDKARVCRDTVPYLTILVHEILTANPDTAIQLYLTWGRPHGEAGECSTQPQFCQYSTMQDSLTAAYSAFACLVQPATTAPVGEAFRYFYGREEFLTLYNEGGGDHHASPTGSYLAAVTHYAALLNTSVVGNTYHAGLDQDTAVSMQEVGTSTWYSNNWVTDSQVDCMQCYCGC